MLKVAFIAVSEYALFMKNLSFFKKTTRKYALLSTPIENRAATRMKR